MYNFRKNNTNLIRKIKVYSGRLFMEKDMHPISEFEKDALSLARQMIKDKDSNLYYCPTSHKRFLINKNKNFFFIIDINSLEILYSQSQQFNLSSKNYKSIITIFDANIFKNRENVEKQINNNIQNYLNHKLSKPL